MEQDGMKRIAMLVVLTVSSSLALAQASKPAATPEPAQPAAAQEAAKPPVRKAAKPAVVAKKSRRSEDARRCLDRASNTEIIKCAEEYL